MKTVSVETEFEKLEKSIFDSQEIPELVDIIDFSDGANNSIELAILPSIDLLLGQLIAEPLQEGYRVDVIGRILLNETSALVCFMDYRVTPGEKPGTILTNGGFFPDETKREGTYLDETATMDYGENTMKISGRISPSRETDGETFILKMTTGEDSLKMAGNVGPYPVQGRVMMDRNGRIIHEGQLSGVRYKRHFIPSAELGGGIIRGKLGDFDEEGYALFQSDGSILMDRVIGPYKVLQKVVFEKK